MAEAVALRLISITRHTQSAPWRRTWLPLWSNSDAWERADKRLAIGYWPWSLLAQPEPLPERLLSSAADAIVDDALGTWGSSADAFPPEVRTHYIETLRDPKHAHAIC